MVPDPRARPRLHVADHAPDVRTKPAFVFQHGLLAAGWIWEDVIARVGGRHRVIVPDLRGHGGSEPSPSDVALEDLVDDLDAIVSSASPGPVILAGVSLGAMVCLRATVDRPHLDVVGLVLIGMPLSAETHETRKRRLATLEALDRLGRRPVLRGMAAWVFGRTTRTETPALIDSWIARAEVLEPAAVIRTARAALDRPNAHALLSRVHVPTLVVVGSEDDVVGRDEARRTAAGIRGATFCEIAGAGHLVPVERGAELAAAIHTWMEQEVTPMADRDEVFTQVREILAQTLRVDPARIQPEAHLEEDLGMDSLRTIETNVALEARFGFVSPEVVRPAEIGIHTVDDLVSYVCSSIGATP